MKKIIILITLIFTGLNVYANGLEVPFEKPRTYAIAYDDRNDYWFIGTSSGTLFLYMNERFTDFDKYLVNWEYSDITTICFSTSCFLVGGS
ncbi:unnamed protein product, partial [marine sediment metagenome]